MKSSKKFTEPVQWFTHGDHPEVKPATKEQAMGMVPGLLWEHAGWIPKRTKNGGCLVVPDDWIIPDSSGGYFVVAYYFADVKKDKSLEPVAFIGTDGNLGWLKKPDVLYSKPVPLFMRPAPDVDAEPVASVHIKDGCLIGSQRKSDADFPDGQYGLYPIGNHPAPAVVRQLVEALDKAQDLIAGYLETFEKRGDKMPYGHKVLSGAQATLAAAKEAGL